MASPQIRLGGGGGGYHYTNNNSNTQNHSAYQQYQQYASSFNMSGSGGGAAATAAPSNTQHLYSPVETMASIEQCVEDHLALFLYSDAIALAEHAHALSYGTDAAAAGVNTNRTLHLLAKCYLRAGDSGQCYRLLKHHFPFSTSPPAALPSPSAAADDHHRLVYMLGVACALSGRYGECLSHMRSIPTPLLSSTPQQSSATTTASLGGAIPSCDRVSAAAILYWIAFCECRQGSGGAGSYWASACCYNPSMLSSYTQAVAHSGGEDGIVTAINSYGTPIAVSPASCAAEKVKGNAMAADGCGDAESNFCVPSVLSLLPSPSPASRSSSNYASGSACATLRQLDAVRSFLIPIVNVTTSEHAYNCVEAYASVDNAVAKCASMLGATSNTLKGSLSFPPLSSFSSSSYWSALVKASCCFNTSDHVNAAKHYSEALKIAPWRLNTNGSGIGGGTSSLIAPSSTMLTCHWINYSTALWHLHDMHALGTLSQTLMTEVGANGVVCAVAGNYYSRLREQKSAVQMFARSLALDPTLYAAQTLMGYEELSDGRPAKASEHFCAALRVNPRAFMAIAGLGEMELRKGNIAAARDDFYKALAINPLPSIIMRYAATFHRRDSGGDELRTAVGLYDEVLSRQPRHPPARLRKAAALLQLGDAHSALDEVEILRHLDGPEEAEVYIARGRCLAALGDKEGAIAAINKAIGLDTRVGTEARAMLEELQSA